jgi:hypothetical protein
MEDLEKLPRWARVRLEAAERQVENLKSALRVLEGEGERPSSVGYRSGDGMEYHALPKDSRIRFSVVEGVGRGMDFIDVHLDSDGRLIVAAGDVITIEPRASNVIHIKLRGR